ncbi:MAG: PD-(D/E)XK nuclease family protein [Pseudomonadota bacterium]
MAVFNIPAGCPFIQHLIEGLTARKRADATLLVPTQRAKQALIDGLIDQHGSTFLPKVWALDDLDARDPHLLAGGKPLPGPFTEVLSPARRHLLLARQIIAMTRSTPANAYALAQSLATLYDQFTIEEISLARVADVLRSPPEGIELAQHHQKAMRLMDMILTWWPTIMAEQGRVDAAQEQARHVAHLTARWEKQLPKGGVVVAGSTASRPAMKRLLAAIHRHGEKGIIILPGLDQTLVDETVDEAVGEDHPQTNLLELVSSLKVPAKDISPWVKTQDGKARRALVHLAMHTNLTEYLPNPPVPEKALKGLTRIICANPSEEAQTIAVIVREALETPGHRVAIVTPDRLLGRLVTGALARWAIPIQDSIGQSFSEVPCGLFLRQVSEAATLSDPAGLLAVLKNPFTRGGQTRADFLTQTNIFEQIVLRDRRAFPPQSFADLSRRTPSVLRAWAQGWQKPFTQFSKLLKGKKTILFNELLGKHVDLCETLNRDHEGDISLWRHHDGNAVSDFLNSLLEERFPILGRDYPALFAQILAEQTHTPPPPAAQVVLWGTLEARLQSANTLILAGLNEKHWPGVQTIDPWLSIRLRKHLGMRSLRWRASLMAHDFCQAVSQPQVFLTRSERDEDGPTTPSRWLQRLALVCPEPIQEHPAQAWAAQLDETPYEGARMTDPCPPVHLRPKTYFATGIGLLRRDPYCYYAQKILRLQELGTLYDPPEYAHFGTLVHRALQDFVRQSSNPDTLITRLTRNLPDKKKYIYKSILKRILDYFSNEIDSLHLHGEVKGSHTFKVGKETITLKAHADCLIVRNGKTHIIEYKTGTPPERKKIESLEESQLPLEALIAHKGGFEGIPRALSAIEVWKIDTKSGAINKTILDHEDLAAVLEGIQQALPIWIAEDRDPDAPYVRGPQGRFVSDFDHLARKIPISREES